MHNMTQSRHDKNHSGVPPSSRESPASQPGQNWKLLIHGQPGAAQVTWQRCPRSVTWFYLTLFFVDFKERWRKSAGNQYNTHNPPPRTHMHTQTHRSQIWWDKGRSSLSINHWQVCVKEADFWRSSMCDVAGAKQRETWDQDVVVEQLEMHGRTHTVWNPDGSFKTEEKDCLREEWTSQNHGSRERANHVSKPVNGGEVV